MEKITLSADKNLIQQARQRAARENRSLDELIQDWLAQYVEGAHAAQKYMELMAQLDHVHATSPYVRDETNER